MRRITTLLIAGLMAAGMSLAGCGGSVSKEDFAANFAEASGNESALTDEQATCLGEHIYDEAGEERINELDGELGEGTTIPADLIGPVAKAGASCVGAGDVLKKRLHEDKVTPEQADCIVRAIDDDDALNQQVWEALAASYGGDLSKADAVKDAIADAATTCVLE